MEDIRIVEKNSTLTLENAMRSGLLKGYFTRKDTDWSTGSPKAVYQPLYITKGNDLIVPRGLLNLLGEEIPIDEKRYRNYTMSELKKNYTDEEASKILDNINLRTFQVDAINRLLEKDRACGQIATGAGKTLIIAGLYKLASRKAGVPLTCIIIVPSSHLFHETSDRLESYGCEVNRYNYDSREIKEGMVNVTMVQSMINDMEKNLVDTDKVDMIIVDEAHHSTAETYYKLITSFDNLRGLYGLSGSLFSKPLESYNFRDLYSFSLGECRLAALYSECVCNITYDDLVKLGFLTDCKIYQIETDIKSSKSNSYVKVAPETIESEERLLLLVQAIKRAMDLGYSRFMCYTRVREAGERFMRYLESEGIKSILAYGGKQNGYLENNEIKYVDNNGLFSDFVSGKFKVLIGTTAVEEGVDVPACDCVVFLAGGQSIRQVLQRAGRGFRLSPGKDYALIIDTYDKGHEMTKKHSNERRKICDMRLNRKVKRVKRVEDII